MLITVRDLVKQYGNSTVVDEVADIHSQLYLNSEYIAVASKQRKYLIKIREGNYYFVVTIFLHH
jgi:hypothetical protein